MNPLLDMLSAAGTVLDTPGSVMRGLCAGEPGRAFGGILDPSQRVSGTEMIGLEQGSLGNEALGFGASILTDPLTWAGGLGLLKLLGRGGQAAEAMPKASLYGSLEKADQAYLAQLAAKRAAPKASLDDLARAAGLDAGVPSVPPVKVRNLSTGEEKFFETWEQARAFKDHAPGQMRDWRIMYSEENATGWGVTPAPEAESIVEKIVKPIMPKGNFDAVRIPQNIPPEFQNLGNTGKLLDEIAPGFWRTENGVSQYIRPNLDPYHFLHAVSPIQEALPHLPMDYISKAGLMAPLGGSALLAALGGGEY